MNGRLYDPLLSMMLSPDNNIQMPQSLQNFNRYSYCLNNPLKYYDPTGEFVESLAFGIAGGAANLVFNARNIDSFGEGVRQQAIGTQKFFKRLQEVNPDLVIENCASGGQRIEPMMCSLSALSSFSDAHENITIPIIAASMHRLLPCRQNQIWAVLRADVDDKRIGYVLSGGMLGRLCLSGDLVKFNDAQMAIVKKALNFYLKLVPVLKNGVTDIKGTANKSRAFPTGCQIVERLRRDGKELMLAFHAFNRVEQVVEYHLPEGKWELVDSFNIAGTGDIEVTAEKVVLKNAAEFSGHVLLLRKI
jgi:alpha-galactosidase